MDKYVCIDCGYIFDEEKGVPSRRMAPDWNAMSRIGHVQGCAWHKPGGLDFEPVAVGPGTKWENVPAGFLCPNCGAKKDAFEEIVHQRSAKG